MSESIYWAAWITLLTLKFIVIFMVSLGDDNDCL
jgi:hypothetical protein